MARTKMFPGPATGGMPTTVLHTQRLTDHSGQPFLRFRYEEPDRPIPEDFHRLPIFTFQVYSTFDLDLQEIGEPAVKRARMATAAEQPKLLDFASYLNYSLNRAQKAMPIFDVYENPLPDALAMVDHQRKEIQHRKAQSARHDVLQIPKVAYSLMDSRKYGFLIAIDSEGFRSVNRSNKLDPKGPLWVSFDRRLPAASSVEIRRRIECDVKLAMKCDDVVEINPEKLEIESKRCQQQPLSEELGYKYSQSYGMSFAENHEMVNTPPMDYAQSENEVGTSEPGLSALSLDDLPELVGFDLRRHDSYVTAKSSKSAAEPTLQYLIYVSYLDGLDIEALEIAARRFVLALTRYLPTATTLYLEFHIPSQPTLSSVLHTYKASSPAQAELGVGALTSTTSIYTATVEDRYPDAATPLPSRVHPIAPEPTRRHNDPRTSMVDPYRTFLVVLDKPDFVERAGVLFLLADGGKRKYPNSPDMDYVEMAVWRSAGMSEVADRLAMVFRPN